MGGCVCPSQADLVLSYCEDNWSDDYLKESRHDLYRRNFDDYFLLFMLESKAASSLQYLNCQPPSIKFTCEKESTNKLAFLEIQITKPPTSFDAIVFRKKDILWTWPLV